MKNILTALLLVTLSLNVYGQGSSIDELVDKGTKLHDNGNYIEAIEYYTQALHIDSNASRPNYEMANTYIAMKKYEKALFYVNKVLGQNGNYMDQAYTLKGTALDMLGQYDEAIQAYREGIKKYPDNYLLNYNAALTYFKEKQYTNAEAFAVDAITHNMQHASSHLILGYCKYDEGKRVEALLCWYYFLLLEPNSKRAENTIALIDKELNIGVKKEAEDKINITIPSGSATGQYAAAELMLSLLAATKYTDEEKKKSEEDQFYHVTESFFKILGELKKNDTDNSKSYAPDVWSEKYIPFFYALANSPHLKTFCYYIQVSKNKEVIDEWLKKHKTEIEGFAKWYDAYYKK